MSAQRHQASEATLSATTVTGSMRGFTLLEVLVALLVLSVGLLGLAGLQTYSLRNNTSALQRSQATVLAYDILDRMRGNRDEAASGSGSSYNTSFGTTVSVPSDCAVNVCSSANMAKYEVAGWKGDIARLLGGDGQITINASNTATVEIRWSDNRDSSNLLNVAVETML